MNFIVIMPGSPSFLHILLLGCVAGFTIYLGLPFALVKSKGLRTFANALSVGILIFILIEIMEKAMDTVKGKVIASLAHGAEWGTPMIYIALLVFGVAGAYLGLVLFEKEWLSRDENKARQPANLAIIIAVGIGLHNFSEGLAIGQELAGGALALGLILVIGFALHNATEGFGIAAPLTGDRPGIGFLFLLGLIGGGPTVVGTIVGESITLPALEIFFLALASGAILYIIAELTHIGRMKGNHVVLAAGIIAGLFVAFGSEIVIDGASTMALAAPPAVGSQQINVVASDNSLTPSSISIRANQPTELLIQNEGTRDHIIAIKELGVQREIELGETTSVFVMPQQSGQDYLTLDPDELGTQVQSRLDVSP